jgi:hypothetical protein
MARSIARYSFAFSIADSEGTDMSDTEQREIAEKIFAPTQTREEIRDALKREEERRAALVKNLYRLRALRLSRS